MCITLKTNENDRPADAPLTDAEFNAWWPFSDDDLDKYERDLEESLGDYEWVPPAYLDEDRRRARMRIRSMLAEKYPNGIPGNEPPDVATSGGPDISAAADDA